MTTQEITHTVKARLPLSAADRQRATKRENESKIDQIIANALQAKRRLCKNGLIERVGVGKFCITVNGIDYLRAYEQALKEAEELFKDL